jgi:hypothetical protein
LLRGLIDEAMKSGVTIDAWRAVPHLVDVRSGQIANGRISNDLFLIA